MNTIYFSTLKSKLNHIMKRIAWVDIVQTIFPSIKEFAFVRMKFNLYRVFCHHKSLYLKMFIV